MRKHACIRVCMNVIIIQIEEHTRQLAQQSLSAPMSTSASVGTQDGVAGVTPVRRANPAALERFRGGARKVMLTWAQQAVTKYVFRFYFEFIER